MNKQKMIASLKQDFLIKRIRAEEQAEELLNSLRQNAEFNNIYTSYSTKQLKYLKSKYEQENLKLKEEVEQLKTKIENFLNAQNLTMQDLQPKYSCSMCEDTGVVNGKVCNCLTKELNKRLSIKSSSQTTFKTFNDANPSIMDETDKKVHKLLKEWCNQFPNVKKININILGGAGAGKTFLLECIESDMLNKGMLTCYKTAFELNELARLYHIGKSFEFADLINVDVLIIDDLGTEPILKNVTKEYLYNIINMRQVKKLPTIISTNLDQNTILERYDERIFSRLANKELSLNCSLTPNNDKRLK